MDYLVGGFSVGLLFGIFATLFWTEAQRPKERRKGPPDRRGSQPEPTGR